MDNIDTLREISDDLAIEEEASNKYSRRQLEDMYDDFLDEIYPEANICGYEYSSSRALKEIDPTAYRCGLNDWADSEGYEEE